MTPQEMSGSGGSPGFGSPMPVSDTSHGFGSVPPMAPTLRAEPDAGAQRMIVGILIAFIVLLSVTVAVLAAGLRHANMASAQPCVAEPSLAPVAQAGAGEAHLPSAASLIPSPTPTPAVPIPTPAPAPAAPAEVVAYVKFLDGIEQRRIALQSAPAPSASQGATPTDPAATTGATASTTDASSNSSNSAASSTTGGTTASAGDVAGQWDELINDFRGQPMPDSCTILYADYLTLLKDSKAAAGKSDQNAALNADAAKADSDLAKLCMTNHADRPFNIVFPGTPAPVPAAQ